MEDIGFFFNYENLVVQLPINPEKVEVKYAGSNKKMEIIKLGEINLLRDRKLATISFESFLPEDTWFPAIRTTGRFEKPEFYQAFFLKIQEAKKPLRFIVTGIGINMLVSIEEFSYHHQFGDHEDKYFKLSLSEYRSYGIRSITIPTTTNGNVTTVSSAAVKNTPERPATEVTIGCSIILNGQVCRDSAGSRPGKTFSNYKGKISLINKKGSHPYHIATPDGGPLGWVVAGAVKLS